MALSNLDPRTPLRVDLVEFAGRTRWIIAQPGRREVAAVTADWPDGHA